MNQLCVMLGLSLRASQHMMIYLLPRNENDKPSLLHLSYAFPPDKLHLYNAKHEIPLYPSLPTKNGGPA